MTATAHNARNPRASVASEIGDTMETETTTREVGAIYVEGFGAMSATDARDTLDSVERLNREARSLNGELEGVRAERDNTRALLETVSDELVRERNERDNERQRLTEQVRTLSGSIEADDPRLSDLWEKAYRYANSAGFCTEFERIAEALGIPQPSLEWMGTALVEVTVTVPVPVSGTATRAEVHAGDVYEYAGETIDRYAIADALNEHTFDQYGIGEWSLESVEDVEGV